MGLFAMRAFARGTRLPAPYKGKKLSWDAFVKTRDQRWCYTLDEGKTWAIDGKALKNGNPLRYVNGAKTAAQLRRVNVVGVKDKGQCWYITTRLVPKGAEFLINYGPGYWQALDRVWARPRRLKAQVRAKLQELKLATTVARKAKLQDELEDLRDELDALD